MNRMSASAAKFALKTLRSTYPTRMLQPRWLEALGVQGAAREGSFRRGKWVGSWAYGFDVGLAKLLSFVLVKARAGENVAELTRRIQSATGLRAMTGDQFGWMTIMYYIRNTGIPVNFGLTVLIALIVGTVVAGQTFYIFTIENLKQFGALKAIGTSNGRLVGMILLQATVVGLIGYALGMGLTAGFFSVTSHRDATRGIVLLWQVMAGSGAVVLFIVLVASLLSIRRVLVLESAIVFRG